MWQQLQKILKPIESILGEYDIKWTQVLSVLIDNCSTVRGVKSGVEILVRQKNPHLLDVSFFLNELKVLQNSIISQVDSRHC